MKRCARCDGFVPEGMNACPNCSFGPGAPRWKAWLTVPLTIAGAGVAAVTLSACYGPACATKWPDGTLRDYSGNLAPSGSCVGYDCTKPLDDGGNPNNDPTWRSGCLPNHGEDGGTDGGTDGGP